MDEKTDSRIDGVKLAGSVPLNEAMQERKNLDKETHSKIAQQLARVASRFQAQRTGHTPTAVTIVLGEDTLVVTLHDALTPAEKALAKSPGGAAQVQEFHRQLFANSTDEMRQEIKRITGRQVREAAAEIETATGTVVHAFSTGAMVQVFLLTQDLLPDAGTKKEKDETMINQQTLQGNWNEIKGKLQSKWGSLTDDDVRVFNGNVDQLLGTIQRKTGEAREGIEQFFEQFRSNGASAISRAGEAVRDCAQQAADSVQDTSKQAAESVREGYAEVEDVVRQQPAQALAVCFGVGLITGVVVCLFLRRR